VELGLHKGLSYDRYAAIDAVRSSYLKGFQRSAAHAREAMLNQTETSAMVLGQALHVALLEPQNFMGQYAAAPKCDRRTNAGKAEYAAFQEANAGKIALTCDEMDECNALAEAAHAHPVVSALLEAPGLNEVSLVWQEPNGLRGKARLDRLTTYEGYSTIIDFKSTRDASPLRFGADSARLAYDMQAAWYLRGADALAPVPRRFMFVALEKGAPHGVALYELDEPFLQHGREQVERALVAYKNATESGVWPGYPTRIQTLYAPGWLKVADFEESTDE
jgi:exodeoxyribonuclease VIII